MFLNIIGWLWIIFGVLFLVWPQLLQKRLGKKSYKTIRKALFLITLLLAGSLISVFFKLKGTLPKIMVFIGVIGVFKAFFLLKTKASDRLIDFFSRQPLIVFRCGGIAYIVIGIIILKFPR